jgi:hypothetical protein
MSVCPRSGLFWPPLCEVTFVTAAALQPSPKPIFPVDLFFLICTTTYIFSTFCTGCGQFIGHSLAMRMGDLVTEWTQTTAALPLLSSRTLLPYCYIVPNTYQYYCILGIWASEHPYTVPVKLVPFLKRGTYLGVCRPFL